MIDAEIEFPVFKEPMLPPSERTMDEIDTWIEEDYLFLFDRKRYEEEKRRLSVAERFVLQ